MAEKLMLGILKELGSAEKLSLARTSIKRLSKKRRNIFAKEWERNLDAKEVLGGEISEYEELIIKAAAIGGFRSVKVSTTRRSLDYYHSDFRESTLDTTGLQNLLSSADAMMADIRSMKVTGAIRMVIRPATRRIVAPAEVEKVHALIMSYLTLSDKFQGYVIKNVNNQPVMIRGDGLNEVRITTWWADYGELYALVGDDVLANETIEEVEREVETRNYYIIGETGAGKSFIGNCLSGKHDFEESFMGIGTIRQEETRIIQNDIHCRVWDTVGLGDDSYRPGEIERGLGELMHCNRTYSKIILVLKPPNRKDITTANLLKFAKDLVGKAEDRLCLIINQVADEQKGELMLKGLKLLYGEYLTEQILKNTWYVVNGENRGKVHQKLLRIFDPRDTPIFTSRAISVYLSLQRLKESQNEEERKQLRTNLKTETGKSINELARLLTETKSYEIAETRDMIEVKITWRKITRQAGYEPFIGEDWRSLSAMRVAIKRRKIQQRTVLTERVLAIRKQNPFSDLIGKLKGQSVKRFKAKLIRLVNEFTEGDRNMVLDLYNGEKKEWQLRLFSLDMELDASVDATLAKLSESLRKQAIAYVEFKDFRNVAFTNSAEGFNDDINQPPADDLAEG